MRPYVLCVLVPLMLLASVARAEVKESGPDHLLVQDSRVVHASPAQLYTVLVDVGHWWNGAHTYSGDASHLSLQAEAGGCFCERWGDQSVAHGRVLWASPGHVLRLESALFAGLFGTDDRTAGMGSFLESGPGHATFTGN